MTNPLDKLTVIIAGLMGKEPSDPDVLKAVVEVVMAMRTPSEAMVKAGVDFALEVRLGGEYGWRDKVRDEWRAMIDALLTEGEG